MRLFRSKSDVLDYTLFAVLVGALLRASLSGPDLSWDVLAYHLPFSLLRAGAISPTTFVLPPHLEGAYQGFPPAIDYLRGGLLQLTGRIEIINTVNVVAVAALCVYLRALLRIRVTLSLLGLLAIPICFTSITTGLTDMAANAAFTVGLIGTVHFFTTDHTRPRLVLVTGLVGLAVAANIKSQFTIISGVAGCVVLLALIRMLIVRPTAASTSAGRSFIASAAVIFVVALYWVPARNLAVYHNPVYPTRVSIGGLELPGHFSAEDWPHPRYQAGWPQPFRWLVSALEFRALDGRTPAYTTGMGDVPDNAMSRTVGGSLGVYVVFLLSYVFIMGLRGRDRFTVALAWCVFALTAFVSAMPGSQEMRYYIAWEFGLLILAIVMSQAPSSTPRERRLLWAAVASAFVFTNAVTGGGTWLRRESQALARAQIDLGLVNARESLRPIDNQVCLRQWGPVSFMFDNYFHNDSFNQPNRRRFRIETRRNLCQPGEVVLTGPY